MNIRKGVAVTEELQRRQMENGMDRLEILMHGQSEVLEMISRGASLSVILESITAWVELQNPGHIFASILLADEQRKHLLHGAAPSLPEEYNNAIHGVAIGPNVGSCGTAAFKGETVIVENIETDILWQDFKDLALRFNLRACWSTPLVNGAGKLLGTFALYYREQKKPSLDELAIIKLVTRTAVIAIEHKLAEAERQRLVEIERRANETSVLRAESSEKRFRQMIEQSPVAIAVLKGEDLVIETANAAVLELWRKSAKVVGMPLIQALPELEGQPFIGLLREVLLTGKAHYGYEALARLERNGNLEEGYFNYVYAPYYEEGVLAGVQVIANEITAQVIAKKELQESEKRFRNLVYEAPVATAIYVGREMRVALANDAMLKVWGKNSSVIGKTLREGLPELEGQPFHQLLDDVFTSGQSYSAKEARADLVVDGILQPFYFNFTYKPLRDANGNIYAILNMAVDVTQSVLARFALEESEDRYRTLATDLESRVQERTRDLQKANESLEKSNAELAQYAYVASHDLQEPLRKIRVFSSMLEESGELNKESADLLSRVITSANRMSQLINDLLEFSRLLNAGRSIQLLDLNEVVRNVMQDFELAIHEKQAKIETSMLPMIEAVPLQMNQLFTNLFSNALKFSRSNVQLKVVMHTKLLDEPQRQLYKLSQGLQYWHITFSDNGIGFESAFAEQIFEVFKRLHTKQAYPGSGIGLALCRKIVENHRGHLFAESEEGKGTTFHIILPERQVQLS
jgi:PAS domain S-box-containing protein